MSPDRYGLSWTSRCALALVIAGCQGKGASPEPRPEQAPSQAPVDPAAVEDFVPPSQDDGGPRITFGELVLEGPRDGRPIVRAAYEGLPALRKCYADHLAQKPDLGGGEVALRLLVSTSGSIDDALLHNNRLPDHRVGTCMLGVVKAWKLPPVDDPEPTRVILPMLLTPPE